MRIWRMLCCSLNAQNGDALAAESINHSAPMTGPKIMDTIAQVFALFDAFLAAP